MRNMRSIGIDLDPWVKKGLLQFHATRPTLYGLESHLTTSIKLINSFEPHIVILDPINAFVMGENQTEVKTMLLRLVDFLKMKGATAFFTNLTSDAEDMENTDVYISSLIDTWLLLRDIEIGGERNRGLYVLKSRGMAHSNQIREFKLSNHGIELVDVYVGIGRCIDWFGAVVARDQGCGRTITAPAGDREKTIRPGAQARRNGSAGRWCFESEFEAEESEALKDDRDRKSKE